MEELLRDLRQSVRLLVREKTFSGAVLLTLAVCLGANVAIYSVIHKVLLEPLPFAAPDRLVTVYNSYPGAGAARGGNGSVDFFERRGGIDAFREVALYQGSGNTVGEAGSTQRVASMRVTPSFFPLLGIEPALGRAFTEDEMEEGNHQKAILTHSFWQEHFGGAADVIGRDLRIDGLPFTVVGVLAPDAPTLLGPEARFILPVPFDDAARQLDNWHSNNYAMLARLGPGATVEQATAQNAALNNALIERWNIPNARTLLEDAGYETVVVPTGEDLVRDVAPLLYLLWAGVAFVLLIGCVNIANLVLARAQTRTTEVATQLALGAPRARVARQLFTEAVAMSLVGAAGGVALGALGLELLGTLGASQLPRGNEVGLDGSVLLFTFLLAVGAGALIGSIPAFHVLRGDLSPVFRTGGRTGTASRRAVLVRNGLVTAQVALAFVMLIGAGLMLMSFRAALSVDPGFRPEGVLTAFVSLPEVRYEDNDAERRFWDELLEQVRALPGVDAAGVTTQVPFGGDRSSSIIFPEGYEMAPGESILSPLQATVGPGTFEALGIDLLEGRDFQATDGPEQQRVIVLDRWLADRYWPEGGAVGNRMVVGAAPGQDSIPENALYTVIGVVQTIKHNDLTAPASEHVGAYYFTYRQLPPEFVSLTVHSEIGEPGALTPAIRATLGRLDAELPLFGVQTLEDRIDESLVRRRIPLVLLGVFAGVAVFLAVIGIYGALAYTVSQRTREIGIRMAMGSAPRDLFRQVVGQGLGMTGVGLAVGAGAAFLLTRLIRSLLFGVQATDLRVTAVVTVVLAIVGLLACVIPARRATSVNPVEALLG